MGTVQHAISNVLTFLAIFIGFIKPNTNISIDSLRQRDYQGSEIKIEEVLTPEKTHTRYITSYTSDGLKIYALLYVPNGTMPKGGWPVIILNHGYIIPEKYTPDGNYIPYANALVKAGYIVFKPNYRGHGKSEGNPTSAYFSPDYVIDNLNAIASIKKYTLANPEKIGIWGHSMGGNISLKDVVINRSDIKAISIWAGVTAPISDIIYNWQDKVSYKPDTEDMKLRNQNRDLLLKTFGTPSENASFWNSIDPNSYLL
jgi:dipeptidyl aminopeptidase/acylaminoacyl peptidase